MGGPNDAWSSHVVRPGRVLRLVDVTPQDLDDLLTDIRSDIPVILAYWRTGLNSARGVVDEIADAMTDIAMRLFPVWLTDDDLGPTVDTATAEQLARELCSGNEDYRPFVVELARAAAAGTAPRSQFSTEIRIRGLARLIRRGYGRESIAVAVGADEVSGADVQNAVSEALTWLAHHGRLTVWLPAGVMPEVTRCTHVRGRPDRMGAPAQQADHPTPRSDDTDDPPVLTISRCEGLPSPHSAAEQALERALSRTIWADGRRWNRRIDDLDPMLPMAIVDVFWPHARLVVEVDGDDHRRPDKYAADRARDNMLQRQGCMVLRYTNQQVLSDVGLVVDELRTTLRLRSETHILSAATSFATTVERPEES
ncbi:endonuclease domain-containing protein [Gordonia sp. OPL2]|uniref:endonuclease domain-containing protein n=1 Tax=Gordonia sp. OPL2 TaxID=2486274 RepID=UPI0016559FCF|nr:DUF559 domain-containing protein [Gordonia sp. OPL2]